MSLASGLPPTHPCADALEAVLEWIAATTDLDDLDYLQDALAVVSDRTDERAIDLGPTEVEP